MPIPHDRVTTVQLALGEVPIRPLQPIDPARIDAAKRGFTTRHVGTAAIRTIIAGSVRPSAGDLVLLRVEKIGQHGRIQLPSGRPAALFVGDEIIVCFGNRYAPNQFEAEVPRKLEPCHLVAAGGVAAKSLSRHNRMKAPTAVAPIGLLGDAAGKVLNLRDFRVPAASRAPSGGAKVIAIAGTSMDAGKTTAAAYLIKGLTRSGHRVAAIKATGTGSCNDTAMMQDAGAVRVLDFVDAGYASTYRVPPKDIERAFRFLLDQAHQANVDYIVVEVADGLLQSETAALLTSDTFKNAIRGVIFCAGDALGALAGVEWLERRGVPVLAVSGVLTASPLAVAEAYAATKLPVLGRDDLGRADIGSVLEGTLALQADVLGAR
jgi:dethiobiotin synthetase